MIEVETNIFFISLGVDQLLHFSYSLSTWTKAVMLQGSTFAKHAKIVRLIVEPISNASSHRQVNLPPRKTQ